ncbi:MAG TPA: VOC family protein [Sphingomonas sp.]
MIAGLPIRQVAYFVADVRAAALRHRALFGSGPYFVADHIATPVVRHRGRLATLDHSSAYGQWGDVMIEFVQQNDASPSAFRDMYPEGSGREGLHHVALFVDDLPAAIARWEGESHECALYAEMASGFCFAMIDTVALYGHMIELYQPDAALIGFYASVSAMAGEGGEPIRPISFD